MVGGLANEAERAAETQAIVKWAFGAFDTVSFFDAGAEVAEADVWLGAAPKVALVAPARPADAGAARGPRRGQGPRRLPARRSRRRSPQGQKLGALEVEVPGHDPVAFDLVAAADVPRGGLLTRINAAARLTRDRAVALPARPLRRHGRGALHQLRGHRRLRQVDPGPGAGRDPARPRRARSSRPASPAAPPAPRRSARLLVEGDPGRWSPETEILLFTAARRDHLERTIRPALARGATVITDRFANSTRVYQGAARADLRAIVDALHALAIGVEPDLTLILDLDPATGARPRPRPRRRRGPLRALRPRLPGAASAPASSRSPPSSPPAAASSRPPATPTRSPPASPRRSPHERRPRRARPPARRAAPARDRGALRPGGRRGALPRRRRHRPAAPRLARHRPARHRQGDARLAHRPPPRRRRHRRRPSTWRRDHPVFRQLAALASPQLFLCRRPWDDKAERLRTAITVDEVRALKAFFQLSAADGGRRVAIVDAADELTAAAANALLKILEEPPARAVLLLVSHRPAALLPTLRSRCRELRLRAARRRRPRRRPRRRRRAAPTPATRRSSPRWPAARSAPRSRLAAERRRSRATARSSTLLAAARRSTAAAPSRWPRPPAAATSRALRADPRAPARSPSAASPSPAPAAPSPRPPTAEAGADRPPRPPPRPRAGSGPSWCRALAERTGHARAVNLDPAQVILDTFLQIDAAAAEARARAA